MTKQAYEAPEMIELGLFEEMTQGFSDGFALDKDFPEGTPKSDLTFS